MRKGYTATPAAHIGALVYYDSIVAGLVPCRILDAWHDIDGTIGIEVQCTATRKGYNKGNKWTSLARDAIPRAAIYRSRQACGQYRVLPYTWTIAD